MQNYYWEFIVGSVNHAWIVDAFINALMPASTSVNHAWGVDEFVNSFMPALTNASASHFPSNAMTRSIRVTEELAI